MKRGKKYVEAAKAIDRGTLYDVADAVALVEQLYCHTELVKRFVSLYLLKTLKLRKLKLLEQIS